MRGRGIGSYRLGDKYVSPDRKLSELLMQESARKGPAYHWSDTLGRIAQGLTGGYLAGRDRKNQNAANEAFTKVEADSFTRQPMISEEQARGSNQVGAILDQYNDQNLMEGPMVQENVRRIGKQQDRITQAEDRIKEANNPGTVYNNPADRDKRIEFENNSIANANDMIDQYGDRFNDQMAIGKGDRDIFVDKEIARQREASEQNVLDKKMPQLDYSMQNLRGLENNPYAQRLLQGLMMNQMQTDAASRLAGTARDQKLADATRDRGYAVEDRDKRIGSTAPKTQEKFLANGLVQRQNYVGGEWVDDGVPFDKNLRSVASQEQAVTRGRASKSFFDADVEREKAQIKTEARDEATKSKPLPTAALKMQEDHIDAIGTAKGLDADLGKWDEMITSGKLDLGFFANPLNAAKTYTGFGGDEQSRNYSSFKTSLEKMRNDSLRLNKGIQTEGDALRIWKELIDGISDEDYVSQRLKELQAVNKRAVMIRKFQIDTIRNNYGKESMDETPTPTAIPGTSGEEKNFVYVKGKGVIPEKRGQK